MGGLLLRVGRTAALRKLFPETAARGGLTRATCLSGLQTSQEQERSELCPLPCTTRTGPHSRQGTGHRWKRASAKAATCGRMGEVPAFSDT